MIDLSNPLESNIAFFFESDGDSGGGWLVRRVQLRERLSEPYELIVSLVNANAGADARELLGQNCTLHIDREPLMRQVRGIASRVERGALTDPRFAACRVHVVPAFALLRQSVNSRIFQEKTVPEILEEVLGAALSPYGREVDAGGLQRSYDPREYTVQYQETDFDFVCRLMEQEGITYRFDHVGDTETLRLSDANTDFTDLETFDGSPVPFVPDTGGGYTTEPVTSFAVDSELTTTSVTLRDFDWTNPGLTLEEQRSGADELGRDRELYVYQRGMTVTGYAEPQYGTHDIATQSELRHQERLGGAVIGRGEGLVTGFLPGLVFELVGHRDQGLDGRYLIVEVQHQAHLGETGGEAAPSYSNRFVCIPQDVTFRPPRRTARPRIHGVQTATVTGPSGEEIHTDVHGRIKVQFHWDRLGANDDHSSVWIRVAQSWGGAGWGFLYIPRIGMEVIVTFVDGDPDRPLVTGCVYNGTHPPPYTLPDDKTKSTIKSESSPGGGGFNELRFEDAAGGEEIYLHAQKDLNEEVLNCHSTNVGVDQSNTVGRNQTELVHVDQSMTVEGNRTKAITGNEDTTVSGNRTESVTGNESITISGSRTESVTGDETITLASNRTVSITASDTLTVNANRTMSITGALSEMVSGIHDLSVLGAQTINVAGAQAITVAGAQNVGVMGAKAEEVAASFSVAVGTGYSLSAGNSVTLSTGKSSITMEKDGTIVIKGVKVSIEGKDEISEKGGKAKLKLDKSKAILDAPKIQVKGKSNIKLKAGKIAEN